MPLLKEHETNLQQELNSDRKTHLCRLTRRNHLPCPPVNSFFSFYLREQNNTIFIFFWWWRLIKGTLTDFYNTKDHSGPPACFMINRYDLTLLIHKHRLLCFNQSYQLKWFPHIVIDLIGSPIVPHCSDQDFWWQPTKRACHLKVIIYR